MLIWSGSDIKLCESLLILPTLGVLTFIIFHSSLPSSMAAIIKPALQPSQALLPKPNYNSPFICDSRKSYSFPARVPFSLSNYKASSRRAASKPVVCATIIDGAFSFSSTNRSEYSLHSLFFLCVCVYSACDL